MQTAGLEEHRQYLHQIDQSLHVIAVIGDFGGEDVLYSELYWIKVRLSEGQCLLVLRCSGRPRLTCYLLPVLQEDPLAPLLPHVDPFDRGFHSLVGSEKHRGLQYIK